MKEVIKDYSQAMEVEPSDVGYLLPAHSLQQEGKLGEAKAARNRAAQSSLNFSDAQRKAMLLLAGK